MKVAAFMTRPAVAVSVAATMVLCWGTPAWAARPDRSVGGTSAPQGIDVSYPQCPATSLPTGDAFAIIGVNGGLANDYNSCLSTEFAYAQGLAAKTKQAPAQVYLNTGDPGNGVADWPSPGQPGSIGSSGVSNPYGACNYASGSNGAGANSSACAFAYGYDMVAGIQYSTGNVVGDLQDFASSTSKSLYNYPLWLDVETGNSWQSGTFGLAMNIADLQGMVAAINHAGGTTTASVGIYSTSYQWGQITGTPTGAQAGTLSGLPDWIPGARKQSAAISNCSLAAFTGGQVTITQWVGQPYDGDYSCIG